VSELNVPSKTTAIVPVRLTPRARRNEIVGWRGETLLVRVTALPVDGRANLALRKLLAETLRISVADVAVISGFTSRDKRVSLPIPAAEQLRTLG
jgi:uncharacterized protein